MAYTVRNCLQETFEDLTILSPNDSLSSTDAQNGLRKLTRLIDNWNAVRVAVYADRFTTYTLVPSLQPHTIGPAASSPTFTVTQRPVSIESANLVLTSVSPAVYQGITIRTAEWWGQLTVPTLSTSIPTDLYYAPDWPLGQIYLWPVPDTAYGLELQTRIVLDDLELDDTLTMPPGYRDALILTLGEMLAPGYPIAVPQPVAAAEARARIFANNDVTPSLSTHDSGMPGHGAGGQYFSWRTGLPI